METRKKDRKMANLAVISAITLMVVTVACNKADGPSPGVRADVEVVDGHLDFNSQETFDTFFAQIKENGGAVATKSSTAGITWNLDGFTSIQDKIDAACSKAETKASVRELSEEEWAAFQAELLLYVQELNCVMDTDLVIAVGDRLYKINEWGTFSTAKVNGVETLESAIASFNKDLVRYMAVNDECHVNEKVMFLKSFKSETDTDNLIPIPDTKAVENGFHASYNTSSFGWRTGFYLFGTTEQASKTIDGNHRVNAKMYSVNYGFYQNAGFAVALQEKVKFLFFDYWRDVSTDYYATTIGVNKTEGTFTAYVGGYESTIYSPSNFNGYAYRCNLNLNNMSEKFLYVRNANLPLVQNFGEGQATFAFPEMSFDGVYPERNDRERSKRLYGTSIGELTAALQQVAASGGGRETCSAIILPYADDRKVKKTRYILSGMKQSRTIGYSEMNFVRQNGWFFGVSTNGWSATPSFNPDMNALGQYVINTIDIFGAVSYNGRWYGIRFVG